MAPENGRARHRVGMLGTGLMGSAMARRLLEQGFEVIAWDRTAEHARALEALGGLARRGTPSALVPLWQQAAGSAAAAASRPAGLHGGALAVEVDSPAWLHALQLQPRA